MKKIVKAATICMAACMSLVFYSCDQKTTDELNAEYADLTIEQNKQKLETEGLAVIEKMDAMKDMEWVSSVQDLMNLMGMGMQEEVNNEINPLLAPLANADKNMMGLASLRASSLSLDSLSNFFDAFGGIYTYNATVDTFAHVPSTTQISIRFPIGESTTNNGTLTIDNYTYQYSTTDETSVFEMPKSLRMTLKNGNTTLLSFTLTASYRDDDMPRTEKTVITFNEGYTFEQTGNYDPSSVSWDFSFALNSDKFFQGGFDMDGSLSYDSLFVESEENSIDRLLNNVNASIQLGNIKAVGKINYAQLMTDQKAFDETYGQYRTEPSQADIIDEKCAIFNKNVKATLLYADTKKAIAKLLFYKVEKQNLYNSWFSMETKAQFEDGSATDASFFDEGFGELQTAIDEFVTAFKANYGIEEGNMDDPTLMY